MPRALCPLLPILATVMPKWLNQPNKKAKKQKKGGWPSKILRKKPWSDISTSQVSVERLRVLGVGSDHFET